jgi:hypothetical protein
VHFEKNNFDVSDHDLRDANNRKVGTVRNSQVPIFFVSSLRMDMTQANGTLISQSAPRTSRKSSRTTDSP